MSFCKLTYVYAGRGYILQEFQSHLSLFNTVVPASQGIHYLGTGGGTVLFSGGAAAQTAAMWEDVVVGMVVFASWRAVLCFTVAVKK